MPKITLKRSIIVTSILLFFTILFLVLVKTVDVQAIGPNGTSVGFATLNKPFMEKFPYNETIDKVTDFLMIFSLCFVGVAGTIGLVQWIKRKNILKVDPEILSMGIVYVITALSYLVFEAFEINYRPVIIDGELKASFPSSHILLMYVAFCLSATVFCRYNFKKSYKITFSIICAFFAILTIVLRLMTGVHWLSDIIGSVIIGNFYMSLYYVLHPLFKKLKQNQEKKVE